MTTRTVEVPTVPVSDKLRAQADQVAADYHAADAARQRAVEAAKKMANRLYLAGMTDSEIARVFGVDRARTVRRWLGKMG
jgi:hypothetical protein